MQRLRIFVALLPLLLMSCSSITLLYWGADYQINSTIDDYFNLNGQQEDIVENELDLFFTWHKSQQLGDMTVIVANFLENYKSDGLTDILIVETEKKIHRQIKATYDKLIEPALSFLLSLTPKQINYFVATASEVTAEMQDEWITDPHEAQKERLANNYEKVEDWIGDLNAQQKQVIAAYIAKYPVRDYDSYFARRIKLQTKFVDLLRKKDANGIKNFLAYISWNWKNNPDKARVQYLQNNRTMNIGFVKMLQDIATAKQKKYFVNKVNDYLVDFKQYNVEFVTELRTKK